MTRINNINPAKLTDQHLLAEHRELPRIFGQAYDAYMAGRKVQATSRYTLGKGHVVFFYDKLEWLATRHRALTSECASRGFKVQREPIVPPAEIQSVEWEPDLTDMEVNLQRLRAKLAAPHGRISIGTVGWWCLQPGTML